MLSASEAYKRSEHYISKETEIELKAANKAIMEAINNGYKECWCYTYLHKQALEQLERQEYIVSNHSDQWKGTVLKIEWKQSK